MEAHPKLKPVDAPTRGVYFAGMCESPKDIKDSVCQAGAAASRSGAFKPKVRKQAEPVAIETAPTAPSC